MWNPAHIGGVLRALSGFIFLYIFLIMQLGCIGKVERACTEHTQCSAFAPTIYCYKGKCSIQACTPGTSRSCYDGPPGTDRIQPCQKGVQVCNVQGQWSSCKGQRIPTLEICDKLDNNCNGQIDEPPTPQQSNWCKCKRPGEKKVCYSGHIQSQLKGVCRVGVQYCERDFHWGICTGQQLPSRERCDGLDNNCNGQIDELSTCACTPGQKQLCYTGKETHVGVGICQWGQQHCTADRKWGPCTQEVQAKVQEICDNQVDDNCNGHIDENCTHSCKAPKGNLCAGECVNLDENHEHCGRCGNTCQDYQRCEQGRCTDICRANEQKCENKCVDTSRNDQHCGQCSRVCPAHQSCISGVCANCKEGTKRTCFSGRSEDRDRGECKGGTQTCNQGIWGPCEGEILPTTQESCDGLDNNCNGQVDEVKHLPSRTCKDKNTCADVKQICVRGTWSCPGAGTTPEVCDGKDNDCNGQIDDGAALKQPCLQTQGVCKGAYQRCENGTLQGCNVPQYENKENSCDGLDNDCNGQIDESIHCNTCIPTYRISKPPPVVDLAARLSGFHDIAVHPNGKWIGRIQVRQNGNKPNTNANKIVIWSQNLKQQTSSIVQTLSFPEEQLMTAAFSRDGRYIYGGGYTKGTPPKFPHRGLVVKWDILTGQEIFRFSVPNPIKWLRTSPHSSELLLVTGTVDTLDRRKVNGRNLELWGERASSPKSQRREASGWITSIQVSANGDRVAITKTNKEVLILDLTQSLASPPLHKFSGLDDIVNVAAFSMDSRYLAVGTGNPQSGPGIFKSISIYIWDLQHPQTTPTRTHFVPKGSPPMHFGSVLGLVFSTRGDMLYSSGGQADYSLRSWRLTHPKVGPPQMELVEILHGTFHALKYLQKYTTENIFLGGNTLEIRQWGCPFVCSKFGLHAEHRVKKSELPSPITSQTGIRQAEFTRDNTQFIVRDALHRITSYPLRTIKTPAFQDKSIGSNSIKLILPEYPNMGFQSVTSTKVHYWRKLYPVSGQVHSSIALQSTSSIVDAVHSHHDASMYLITKDKKIHAIDAFTQQREFQGTLTHTPERIVLSRSTQRIAISLQNGNIEIWDPYKEQHYTTLSGPKLHSKVYALAFHPHRQNELFVSYGTHIALWDISKKQVVRRNVLNRTTQTSMIQTFAIHPNGKQLVIAQDKALDVYNVDVQPATHIGHLYSKSNPTIHSASDTIHVVSLNWSHDGRMIAASLNNREFAVWKGTQCSN